MSNGEKKIKPGYRTTEFWLVGLPGLLLTALQGLSQQGLQIPDWSGPIMAAVYAIGRAFAKK